MKLGTTKIFHFMLHVYTGMNFQIIFRLSGCWYQAQRCRCVVSLGKTLYPLLSTGSIQEDRKASQHD